MLSVRQVKSMNSNQELPPLPVWLFMFAKTIKKDQEMRRKWMKADIHVQKSSRPVDQNTVPLSCSELREALVVP